MNAPATAAPAAAPAAAPQAAQLADFDSMMDSAPTGFEEPAPVETPAQQQTVDDLEEAPELGDEGAPAEDDGDDLLDDEPAAAGPEALTAAADKWKQLEDSPELPAEFAEKLWTVKPNGREMQVTIDEMAKGYMRLNESTRRSQQLDQREEQVAQSEQRFEQFFQRIKEPEAFLEVFERQLGPEVLDKALEIRQARRDEDISIIEAAGIATMRRLGIDKHDPRVREAMLATKNRIARERQLDIETRKLAAKNRELEARTQHEDTSKRVAELRATFERQLAQLTPTAFKAARIRDNAKNRDAHISHLKAIMRKEGASTITREIVAAAARAVREDLEDERAARQTKVAQPGAAGKSQPRAAKGAGGGIAPTRGHVSSGPKKLADFDDHFGL
jgi:hypothetical protein